MKHFFTLFIALCSFALHAQVQDNFSDGDFTNNPTWSGTPATFTVANGELQLNGANPATVAYLTTPATVQDTATWEFKVSWTVTTTPSSANNTRVYLMSANADLTSTTNQGYYIQLGENGTADAIKLYKTNNNTNTLLFTGITNIDLAAATLRIRVTRTTAGVWRVLSDPTGGTNFLSEGTPVTDNTYTSSAFFGVRATYSTANLNAFKYDDIYVAPIFSDNTAPALVSATALTATTLDVLFDENLTTASANNTANYSVSGGIGAPQTAALDAVNNKLVHLTFATAFTNNTYTLTTTNLQDAAGNASTAQITNFQWFIADAAAQYDILINEIYADFNPIVGLPAAQYVELYNRSTKTIDLSTLRFYDAVSSGNSLSAVILPPNAYAILCDDSNANLFTGFGTVVTVPTMPSLNITGDSLTLTNTDGSLVIHSVKYNDTWYNDATKKQGGWSLELISPLAPCVQAANWTASNNASGGTPAAQNSVYSNVADTQAPILKRLDVLNPNTLLLVFNEAVTNPQATNFTVNNGVGAASTITILNDTIVRLTFANNFTSGTLNQITATNVADCSGNAAPSSLPFTYYLLSPAAAFDILINEIYADFNPIVGLPAAQYVELFNRSTKNIDLRNLQFSDATSTEVIESLSPIILLPNSYAILCDDSNANLFTGFGTVVTVPTMPSLNISGDSLTLTNADGSIIIHSVKYNDTWYNDATKKQGGWSLELISPLAPCVQAANWTASTNPSGGTPAAQNSVYSNIADTQAPALAAVTVTDNNTLELTFNEPITNPLPTNFSVNNGVGAATSVAIINATTVSVDFANSFANGISSQITATGVTDCSGNAAPSSLLFIYYLLSPAAEFDILINEIYADFSPSLGVLPSAKYVELFNRSTKNIDLSTLQFSDAVSAYTLSATILPAGQYAVLCDDANAALFAPFGRVVTVSTMPSLNATSDSLTLSSVANGTALHIVQYTIAWYQDALKSEGGWSLELKNPSQPCAGASNWIASTNPNGGTPATQNSVYNNSPDTQAPTVTNVLVLDNNSLQITFSEELTPAAANPIFYSVNNSIGAPSSVQLNSPTIFILNFTNNFINNTNYTLAVNGLSDCSGNAANSTKTFTYIEAQPAARYDLLINEIMADPTPVNQLPEADFIEIYNRSNKYINLFGYTLTSGTQSYELPYYLIAPDSFLIITKTGTNFNQYGSTMYLPAFPTLNLSDDDISITAPSGEIIDAVVYTDAWYQSSVKRDGGWTLERISPLRPCEEGENWRASNDPRGGTPGTRNSIYEASTDTNAPLLIRAFPIAPDTLRLFFTEAMQESSLLTLTNITIDNTIGTPTAVILEAPFFKTARLVLSNTLQPNILYTVSVNVKDCVGNNIGSPNSAKFALPVQALNKDIIINEVLFNPNTGGVEFIELYNRSNKIINLSSVRVTNGDINGGETQITPVFEDYLFLPNEYLVITDNKTTLSTQYNIPSPTKVIEIDVPTLDDKDGIVNVYANGITLDSLSYSESWQYALLDKKDGVSLERIDFDKATNDPDNWHSASAAVGYATPTYKNSQVYSVGTNSEGVSITPDVFSPDQDGYNDFAFLNIKGKNGYTARVNVYDAMGRFVAEIANNRLLGEEDNLQWDGLDAENKKAPIGVYVIVVELFNTTGKKELIKKTCVVAHRD